MFLSYYFSQRHQHNGQYDFIDGKVYRSSGGGGERKNGTTGGRETEDGRFVVQNAT